MAAVNISFELSRTSRARFHESNNAFVDACVPRVSLATRDDNRQVALTEFGDKRSFDISPPCQQGSVYGLEFARKGWTKNSNFHTRDMLGQDETFKFDDRQFW